MKEYHTEVLIQAPIEAVWKALTDFESYPKWNPLVGWLEGDFQTGGSIRMFIRPLGRSFKARLRRVQAPEEMTWIGVRVATWFLSGEHYYRLESLGSTTTRLRHGEYFRGLASAFLPASTLQAMEETFQEHNRILRDNLEND